MHSPTLIVFRKELRDALRSRLVLLLVAGLGLIVIVSVVVSTAAFHLKVLDYQHYVAAMTKAGQAANVSPPQLFPLQLLRGAIEYLEIVGSIVAIVIGYGLAAKEKNRGTLRLLYSRPVQSSSIALGKLLAVGVVWFAVIVALGVIMGAAMRIVGGTSLSAMELAKLAIALGLSWMYLVMWSTFSYWLTGRTKQLSTALVLGLILWLGFVLIIPQIGDTMDPDNQVPGGLFRSLQVDKPHELAVMARFSGYETTRNLLEETSPSKRFERAAFAYLGAKDKYNQQSLGFIGKDMWTNIAWLVVGLGAAIVLAVTQSNRRNLLRKA
ncbi:MAG: ABC transporter permease [Actinobacteria bacterium]|nr:ABC transporter permease [Actinomycetota bacterium]